MEDRDRESVSITSARYGHSVDLRHRQTRYLVSMAIRTACFVAAVLTSGPLRWSFVVAAIFLPYIAVILANAGSKTEAARIETVETKPIGEITDKPHHEK